MTGLFQTNTFHLKSEEYLFSLLIRFENAGCYTAFIVENVKSASFCFSFLNAVKNPYLKKSIKVTLFILKGLKFHRRCWDFYLKVLLMYKLVICKAHTHTQKYFSGE